MWVPLGSLALKKCDEGSLWISEMKDEQRARDIEEGWRPRQNVDVHLTQCEISTRYPLLLASKGVFAPGRPDSTNKGSPFLTKELTWVARLCNIHLEYHSHLFI